MKNLLIEQRGAAGVMKVWRLRSEEEKATFGASKHVELRSPDYTVKGIQGIFEFHNKNWRYVNLDLNSSNIDEHCVTEITQISEFKVGNTVLRVVPFEGKDQLLQSIDDLKNPGSDRMPYQLFAVYVGDQLLETRLIPIGANFTSKFDPSKMKIKAQKTNDWSRNHMQNLDIHQCTVYLSKLEAMKKLRREVYIEKEVRIPLYVTLFCMGLMALMFLFSPNSKDAGEAAVAAMPPQEYREIKLEKPKKKVAQAQSAPLPKEVPPETQVKEQKAPTGQKSISAIKSLGMSRISQLIGKVSAGTARSANVIVTSGVKAGSEPAGRGLSALGSVTQNGKDWSREGAAKGTVVNTVGVTNSKGLSKLGALATGKTGTGGAELLEDESEIVGGLDREIIAGYIRTQLGQILYCYERQLSASPDLYGKVSVKFTIGPKGEVETQRIGESTMKNANVEGCILQKVARWRFPPPDGGTKVNVTYPFLFKSTN